MISTLHVGYSDVSARSLAWALGLSPRPALSVLSCDGAGAVRVELRLLGASHQVLVHQGDALLCSETVACDLPESQPLPRTARENGYRLSSLVRTYDAHAFEGVVDKTTRELESRADALVGHFPGQPGAVTALAIERSDEGAVGWSTWHGYPQTGELVRTRTVLQLSNALNLLDVPR